MLFPISTDILVLFPTPILIGQSRIPLGEVKRGEYLGRGKEEWKEKEREQLGRGEQHQVVMCIV